MSSNERDIVGCTRVFRWLPEPIRRGATSSAKISFAASRHESAATVEREEARDTTTANRAQLRLRGHAHYIVHGVQALEHCERDV